MNLPNKLTLLRVFMIPFFVVFMLTDLGGSYGKYIALAIFIAASLTDMLDGKIARKYNLVTNFGKFMDPLADKLLVCSAMICLVDKGRLASWIVIIIISREFIISGFRLIASDNGVVIAGQLLGQVQDRFPDAHDHCAHSGSGRQLCAAGADSHLRGADPYRGVTGGLPDEKQRRLKGWGKIT